MVFKAMETEQEKEPVTLSATGIYKSFHENEVLHGVDFILRRGQVHGLVGQNGAGKSTLMKIINGLYSRDRGTIHILGKEAHYHTPAGALEHGIAMVYQEFSLVPTMTVAQNLFLAREPLRNGMIDDADCIRRAGDIFRELNVEIDPSVNLASLSIGNQQVVEIAKALLQKPSVLILDEPTASLTQSEIESLFVVIRRLKENGISIIFVSHHLQEIMDICDQVTVLRDGIVALNDDIRNIKLKDMITAMIGKEFSNQEDLLSDRQVDQSQPLLEVKNLSWKNRFHAVSFKLFNGEILGIAGVMGSGRTEILKTLFGIYQPDQGEVLIHGKMVKASHPSEAIRMGMSLIPEDRRKVGIIPGQSIRMNVLLPIWQRLIKGLLIDDGRGKNIVEHMINRLNIKATNMEQYVERLSGGNQQKVVFAKTLSSEPKILLLDDPTVGVDVEAKQEIGLSIRKIADEGNGVILVSSEMKEIASLCDRVLILWQGQIIRQFSRGNGDEISESSLLHAVQSENGNI